MSGKGKDNVVKLGARKPQPAQPVNGPEDLARLAGELAAFQAGEARVTSLASMSAKAGAKSPLTVRREDDAQDEASTASVEAFPGPRGRGKPKS